MPCLFSCHRVRRSLRSNAHSHNAYRAFLGDASEVGCWHATCRARHCASATMHYEACANVRGARPAALCFVPGGALTQPSARCADLGQALVHSSPRSLRSDAQQHGTQIRVGPCLFTPYTHYTPCKMAALPTQLACSRSPGAAGAAERWLSPPCWPSRRSSPAAECTPASASVRAALTDLRSTICERGMHGKGTEAKGHEGY